MNGTLNVNGTAAEPVTFQAQNGTAPGTWYGIILRPTATAATITNAVIEHAVVATADAGGVMQLTHTAIQACSTIGVVVSSGSRLGFLTITGMPVGITNDFSAIPTNSAGDGPIIDAVTISSGDTGVELSASTNARITNAVIHDNAADGIDLFSSSVTIVNVTVNGNGGYGIRVNSGQVTAMSNAILTNNTQCNILPSGQLTLSYSDIWPTGVCGTFGNGGGNISANPQYVDVSTDLHLTSTSVCIDAGSATSAPDHDRDGNPRPVDGNGIPDSPSEFDMGAYEFQLTTSTTVATTSTTPSSTSTSTSSSSSTSLHSATTSTSATSSSQPTTSTTSSSTTSLSTTSSSTTSSSSSTSTTSSTSTSTSTSRTSTSTTSRSTSTSSTTTSTSSTTSTQPPTTITTTTTRTMTSTSTTAPCTSARCVIDAGLQSTACAGETVPASVTNDLNRAVSLIGRAATSQGKQARRLVKRAKRTLKEAKARATRAAKAKKLSADCARALGRVADQLAASL